MSCHENPSKQLKEVPAARQDHKRSKSSRSLIQLMGELRMMARAEVRCFSQYENSLKYVHFMPFALHASLAAIYRS